MKPFGVGLCKHGLIKVVCSNSIATQLPKVFCRWTPYWKLFKQGLYRNLPKMVLLPCNLKLMK